ncbi:TPA: hypothetical protein ACS8DH_000810 [Providencia alcalifaciens]
MLRHVHQKDQKVKIILPDGSYGFISTDRRCKVSYDLPANIKIEIQPPVSKQQGGK